MCLVPWHNFIRRDCTEVSWVDVGSFKFFRSSHFFCVLRSHSKSVKASGSKWILNQALSTGCFLPAVCSLTHQGLHQVLLLWRPGGLGCCADRVLTQHPRPGLPLLSPAPLRATGEFWCRYMDSGITEVVLRLNALNLCGAAEGCFAEKELESQMGEHEGTQ